MSCSSWSLPMRRSTPRLLLISFCISVYHFPWHPEAHISSKSFESPFSLYFFSHAVDIKRNWWKCYHSGSFFQTNSMKWWDISTELFLPWWTMPVKLRTLEVFVTVISGIKSTTIVRDMCRETLAKLKSTTGVLKFTQIIYTYLFQNFFLK